MPIIKIFDIAKNKEIEREMNAEELAQFESDQAKAQAEKQAREEAIAAKTTLLERLGITEEEAKLLLS